MPRSPFTAPFDAPRANRDELASLVGTWALTARRRARIAAASVQLPSLLPLAAISPVGPPEAAPSVLLPLWADHHPISAAAHRLGAVEAAVARSWRAYCTHLAVSFPHPGHAPVAAGVVVATIVISFVGLLGAVGAGAGVLPRSTTAIEAAPATGAGGGGEAPAASRAVPVAPDQAAAAPTHTGDQIVSFPAPAAQPEPITPASPRALPLGTGMWMWQPEKVEGGNATAIVAKAKAVGLDHIYVRTGSSNMGFYAQDLLDDLLPKAHAAGIRIYGWDFPYLRDVGIDAARAMEAITYTTPSGHRIDGFAPDIETRSEGTNLSAAGAQAYSGLLRRSVGWDYPLIAVVPRPSATMQTRFPYDAMLGPYDAVAPMTYWLNRQPDSDVINDVTFLSRFGKPVIPIGQAYDGRPEGGRPGPPPPGEIRRFMAAAEASGAAGVSFWSWQHASPEIWRTIADSPEFRWESRSPELLRPGQIRGMQSQLNRLGHRVGTTGVWDQPTIDALRSFQASEGLTVNGRPDIATIVTLKRPGGAPR